MSEELTYKTHILIGMRANGVISVIADWPHLPKQAEVLEEIRQARETYTRYALCTPTSIISGGGNDGAATGTGGHRRGI